MKVKDIMSFNPLIINGNYTVKETVKIFSEKRIDAALIVDEEKKLIGIFTKTHIYRMILNNVDMKTQVKHVMKRGPFLTGQPDDEFENAVTSEVPRLPVTDEKGMVIGILTRGDIARAFFHSYHSISRQLEAIINSTHNMIISVDRKGRVNVFNRAAENILGVKAKDVMGKPIVDILPTSRLMNVIKTGKPEPLQKITLKGKNFISNRSPIIKDGTIIGAVSVLQDMSDIQKVSQELEYIKELNEEFNAIFTSSYDGLYICDGEGTILRLNQAFEMITGINGGELLGRNEAETVEEGIVSESLTRPVLQKKEPVTIIQKTRAGKTALATGNPVFDSEGQICRIVSNVRDITELNMLKQKLDQAESLTQHYESELETLRLRYAGSSNMVVNSPGMRKLMEMVIRLAKVDSTVLIAGESGTGKELIAETLHRNSPRRKGPFIKVNCGAIPENLLESELFGYEAGAFTGAKKEGKPGYFELASGGILLLDEIGELPLSLQVKLLRALQSMEITRVGGTYPLKIDVRIMAATNRDLLKMVQRKQFREDLYYRLNVVPIYVPPVRDRKEDITQFVVHFMQVFNKKYQLTKRISPEVIDIFMKYDWPGNVRELENLIERLIVITPKDIITREDLPSNLSNVGSGNVPQVLVSGIVPLKEAVESVEKQILEKAYVEYNSTRQMAGELKVAASTIVRKAAKYGIKTAR